MNELISAKKLRKKTKEYRVQNFEKNEQQEILSRINYASCRGLNETELNLKKEYKKLVDKYLLPMGYTTSLRDNRIIVSWNKAQNRTILGKLKKIWKVIKWKN